MMKSQGVNSLMLYFSALIAQIEIVWDLDENMLF
jgi:hypothetical protein